MNQCARKAAEKFIRHVQAEQSGKMREGSVQNPCSTFVDCSELTVTLVGRFGKPKFGNANPKKFRFSKVVPCQKSRRAVNVRKHQDVASRSRNSYSQQPATLKVGCGLTIR